MVERIQNLRLTTRVYFVVGALLITTLVVAGAGLFSAMRLGGLFVEYRSVARLNLRYGELQEYLLNTRLQAFRWRATRSEDALNLALRELGALNATTEDARALAKAGGESQVSEELAIRSAQSRDYLIRFTRAIELHEERNAAVDAFRATADATMSTLRGLRDSAYEDGDIEALRHAGVLADTLRAAISASERFLVQNDEADSAASLEAFNRATGDIATLLLRLEDPSRRAAALEVQAGVSELEIATEGVVQTIRARNAIFQSLDQLGPELAAAYSALADDGAARQDRLGPIATRTVHDVRLIILIIAGSALAIGGVFGLILARNIAREARRVVEATQRLATGDLDTKIEGADRDNEFGRIASALAVFQASLRETQALRAANDDAKQLEALRAQRREELLALGDKFESNVGSVVETVTAAAAELQATAAQLASTADTSLERSSSVAGAADQANANVQAVAAASEELATAIAEVATRVTGSADVARRSAEGASDSERELDTLHHALEEVDTVIAAIDDVAEQTNLLALNATIEAARAGEAGRGFAVVASEVKSLANQTKQMTQEIAERLGMVRTSASRAIESTRVIIRSVQDIDASSTAVAASVEEQGGATSEISRNAQEAAGGAEDVSRGIADVRAAAEETSQATHGVRSAADELSQQAERLKANMHDFMRELRAA